MVLMYCALGQCGQPGLACQQRRTVYHKSQRCHCEVRCEEGGGWLWCVLECEVRCEEGGGWLWCMLEFPGAAKAEQDWTPADVDFPVLDCV